MCFLCALVCSGRCRRRRRTCCDYNNNIMLMRVGSRWSLGGHFDQDEHIIMGQYVCLEIII